MRKLSKKSRRGMTVVENVMIIAIAAIVIAGIFTVTKAMLQKSGTNVSDVAELNETTLLEGMEINGEQIQATTGQDSANGGESGGDGGILNDNEVNVDIN